MTGQKKFEKLNIKYKLPEIIVKDIEEMIACLNGDQQLFDCHVANLRSDINSHDEMPEDVTQMLIDYYCRGGILQ